MAHINADPGQAIAVVGHTATSSLDRDALASRQFASVAAIEPQDISGILAIGRSPDELLATVRQVRSDVRLSHYPVVAERINDSLAERVEAEIDALVDGYVNSLADADARTGQYWTQLGGATAPAPESPDECLLAYMVLRGDKHLRPIRDWQSRGIFRYPLLECLSTGSGVEVLNLLTSRGALAREELVERLRLCPECAGAHLVYVDTCPACHSLDLERDEAIHCFTCGHVAGQRAFLVAGGLTCPNCRARLRHIGVDYDRPLENHSCRDCGELFAEPEVLARCAICTHTSTPDALVIREIGTYRLTEYGRMMALHGEAGELSEVFDPVQFLRLPVFEHVLTWQLQVVERYEPCHFSVVVLRLSNLESLASQIGPGRLSILLQGFAERLRETIRTSDLCTRTREPDFWVLLPQTDGKGSSLFVERLQELVSQSRQLQAAGLEFQAASWSSRDVGELPGDGPLLMEELAARLPESADA